MLRLAVSHWLGLAVSHWLGLAVTHWLGLGVTHWLLAISHRWLHHWHSWVHHLNILSCGGGGGGRSLGSRFGRFSGWLVSGRWRRICLIFLLVAEEIYKATTATTATKWDYDSNDSNTGSSRFNVTGYAHCDISLANFIGVIHLPGAIFLISHLRRIFKIVGRNRNTIKIVKSLAINNFGGGHCRNQCFGHFNSFKIRLCIFHLRIKKFFSIHGCQSYVLGAALIFACAVLGTNFAFTYSISRRQS